MIQLFIGSLLLSIIHAAIPNHWIPLVFISRTEGWKLRETVWYTALVGLAHTFSTILLGVIIGVIGLKLAANYKHITEVIAPLVLVFMGLVYLSTNTSHSHHEHIPDEKNLPKRSKKAILITLFAAMFFSPCLEIETYYFTAGTFGWPGILTVSATYMFVTVGLMVLLVTLGCKGVEKFKWEFLEHHEKKITGSILILLGLISFFLHH